MTGLLARPERETRNRRAEGAKASAVDRREDDGAGSAAGRGAASLDTVPAISRGVGWRLGEQVWWGVGHGLTGGCCEV